MTKCGTASCFSMDRSADVKFANFFLYSFLEIGPMSR